MAFWNRRRRAKPSLADAERAMDDHRWTDAERHLAELAAERIEVARVHYLLAQCHFAQARHEAAFTTAREAATLGSAEAMFMVHQMCMLGTGTSRDEAEARRWCEAAAEAGSARAAYNAGASSATGSNGFSLSHREAVRWYRRAVELGHAQAAFGLGMLYVEGDEELRDRDQAALAFVTSARLGFPAAETLLEVSLRVQDEETVPFLVATACAIDPEMGEQLLRPR